MRLRVGRALYETRAMDSHADLKAYVARLEALREKKSQSVTDQDVREIMRELGWSKAEMDALDSQIHDHVQRGENFAAHGLWDNAVKEFNDAVLLAPTRLPAIAGLANAHFSRFETSKAPVDLERAEKACRRCLELDASHHGSYALLAEIDRLKKSSQPQARGSFVMVFAGIGVAAIAGVGAFIVAQPAVHSGPTEVSTFVVAPSDFSTSPGPFTLDLVSPELKLDLDARKLDHSEYADSAYLTYAILLTNKSDQVVKKAKGRIQLLDASGTVVAVHPSSFHDTHLGDLRPGDVAQLHGTIRSVHGVVAGRLIVEKVESVTAPSKFPASEPVELHWDIPKPPSVDIAVSQRKMSAEDPATQLGNIGYFQAEWELENRGDATLSTLKLEYRLLNKSGKVLDTQDMLTVFSATPTFQPGEKRVEFGIKQLNSSDFDRYELHVVEAE